MKEFGENIIQRYLLGELSGAESEKFEERYFEDDEFFGEIQAAEMALIDLYVKNAMTEDERARFELNYMTTPERRARVAESAAFHRELAGLRTVEARTVAEEKVPFLERLFTGLRLSFTPVGFATAGLVVVMTAGLAWLANEAANTRNELMLARNAQRELEADLDRRLAEKEAQFQEQLAEQRGADSETLAALENDIERLQNELDAARKTAQIEPPAGGRTPSIATFMLAATRGGAFRTQVSLSRSTKLVALQVPVSASETGPLEVSVMSGTKAIVTARNVRPRQMKGGRMIAISVQARHLSEGEYEMVLRNAAGEEMKRGFTVAFR